MPLMNDTLIKALVALLLVCLLLWRSFASMSRQRSVSSILRLVGTGFLLVVALTHICEALRILPWMHWGAKRSVGHYIDLWSAVLGLTLFAIGFLTRSIAKRRIR